jgi:ATP-dependent helicase/nuclease subunit A
MLVEAAAGTGKTTAMVGRMIALLRSRKARISQIAAITFTNKAADELRARFRARLESEFRRATGKERDALHDALRHIDKAFIGTIHSFCGRLLRERPVEAGADPSFIELDEVQDMDMRRRAWAEYVNRAYASGNPVLDELADVGVSLEELAPSFEVFANYPDVDEWPVEDPPPSLPSEAKMRAFFDDVAQLVDGLRPRFPTHYGEWDNLMRLYDGVARMIRHTGPDAGPDRLVAIMKAFKDYDNDDLDPGKRSGGAQELKEDKKTWKGLQKTRDEFLDQWRRVRYSVCLKVLIECRDIYDRKRREASALNFQDLLMKAAALLQDQPSVREYFGERFTRLLVDEFQDTDPIQARVMMYLTANDPCQTDWTKCAPRRGSLFVVGDPKQSIYRFRRADIVTYQKVKDIIVNSGGKVVSFQTNFRSSPDLIGWVNGVFQGMFPQKATAYAPEYAPLLAAPGSRPTAVPNPPARMLQVPNSVPKEERAPYDANAVAREIRRLLDEKAPVPLKGSGEGEASRRPCRPSDFLVLTWKMKNLPIYAAALRAQGIPCRVTGGDELNRTSELRLLTLFVRAALNPDDPVALAAVLRSELFGVSDSALYEFKKSRGHFNFYTETPSGLSQDTADQFTEAFGMLRKGAEVLYGAPAVSAVEHIAEFLGLTAVRPDAPLGAAGPANVLKAVELLRANAGHTLRDALTYLETLAADQESRDAFYGEDPDFSAVRIMNLHKAKGLEAPFVFLADPTGYKSFGADIHVDRSGPKVCGYMLMRGPGGEFQGSRLALPPNWKTASAEEKKFSEAERNRLLYVAATRAGEALVISHIERPAQGRDPNQYNFWNDFAPHTTPTSGAAPSSADGVASIHGGVEPTGDPTVHDEVDYEKELEKRRDGAVRPTYSVEGVKAASIETVSGFGGGRAQYGREFGAAVHHALEHLMKAPDSDPLETARRASVAEGCPVELAEEVAVTLNTVMTSALWKRAIEAKRRLTEVPFQALEKREADDGKLLPLVMRGVIDLVFEEDDGWVIVDYKTDGVPKKGLQPLIDLYKPQIEAYGAAWARLTGEPVIETGLFFTAASEYVRV